MQAALIDAMFLSFKQLTSTYQCPDQIRTLGNLILRDEQGQTVCGAWDVFTEAAHCYLTVIK